MNETIAYYGFPNTKNYRHPAGECAKTFVYTDT